MNGNKPLTPKDILLIILCGLAMVGFLYLRFSTL